MWLLHGGEVNKDLPKIAEEQVIFVGPKENPIDYIKRKEINNIVDGEFLKLYDIWQKFNLGFGLPFLKSWSDHPKWMIDVIEILEIEHKKMKNIGSN